MTMGPAPDAARETRRAELQQIYATWVAADVAALKTARHATFRRDLPGCAVGILVLIASAVALLSAFMSDAPWSDPWVLARLPLAAVGCAWFTRRFLLARRDAGDAELFAQDDQLDRLVARLVAQVRPGATYEPSESLEDDWLGVARLIDANRQFAPHVVRWDIDGVPVAAAETSASFYQARPDGTLDDQSGQMRFKGWVAVARLSSPRPWALRARPRASAYPDTCDDPRFVPVPIAGLQETYDVRGTAAETAPGVLTSELVRSLAGRASRGEAVHLGTAGRSIVVAVEREDSWFHRLHPRLDADHAVALGETLDTLHHVMDGVLRALRDAPTRR